MADPKTTSVQQSPEAGAPKNSPAQIQCQSCPIYTSAALLLCLGRSHPFLVFHINKFASILGLHTSGVSVFMRLMIVESAHQGHHLMYVRRLMDGLAPLVASVVFVTEKDIQKTPEFQTHIAPVAERLTIDDTLNFKPGRSQRAYWSARLVHLAERIKHHGVQHVMLPTGDELAVFAGRQQLLGQKPPWDGIKDLEIEATLIRACGGYPPRGGMRAAARQWLTAAALKRSPLRTMHMIDFVAHENLQRNHPALAARFSLMPDPLDPIAVGDRAACRRLLGLPLEGRIVGTLGFMEARKGIRNLLDAFRHADLLGTDRLVLMGHFSEEARELLRSNYADLLQSQRVIVQDRYLTDVEFLMAIRAMDLVCTPYRHHLGPSGVAIRALALGTPVLANAMGWSEVAIPRFGMGWVCDTENPVIFAEELGRRLEQAREFVPSEKGRQLVRYLSAENFVATWAVRLRQRMGLAANENLLGWVWGGLSDK